MKKVTRDDFKDTKSFQTLNKLHLGWGRDAYFLMALSHLFNEGFEAIASITDEDLKTMQSEIEQKQKEGKGRPIMTPEFQIQLVKTAREISEVGMWDVLKYIQNYVSINK